MRIIILLSFFFSGKVWKKHGEMNERALCGDPGRIRTWEQEELICQLKAIICDILFIFLVGMQQEQRTPGQWLSHKTLKQRLCHHNGPMSFNMKVTNIQLGLFNHRLKHIIQTHKNKTNTE